MAFLRQRADARTARVPADDLARRATGPAPSSTTRRPHLWVKGIPTAGVGNIDKLFRKVVWVATGSGIGPCLPHLLAGDTPSLLVWSTRHPRQTYGDALVDEILAVQPDAIIWDTDAAWQTRPARDWPIRPTSSPVPRQ